ncbi:MAG: cell wall metabolism sensor histidine kinase WalK [Chloroflexota bacterium]|nr:cell wall metabolism sensor histidine kinase WalK [Chloroflexota bacterium]
MRALVRTIPRRAALAALAGLLAGIVLLAIAAPGIADRHDAETLQAWLGSEARLAGDLAHDGLLTRDPNVLDPLAHRVATSAGVRVTFIDPSGVVLGESDEDRTTMDNHASRPEVAAALAGNQGSAIRVSATVQRDLLYVAVPVRDGGQIIGVARTALPMTTLESFASRLGGTIALAGVLATAVALAVVVLLSRAVTGPIGALTRSAETVAGGGSARFEAGGPDETRRLGDALRTMSDRITGERHDAESERDRLAVLIDELGDAIVIADADGRIERANRAASELLGAPLAGRRLMDVVRDHEAIDAIANAHSDDDSVGHIERTDPPRFQRVVARRLADGELLLVIQDLTNLRRLQTVRRDFVANVSHELRTPLASLKAMAETLEAGAIDDHEVARDFVRRMRTEIDDLARLVEELLLIGRLESGQPVVAPAVVSPAALLEGARERLGPLAERAQVRLVVDRPERVPMVAADSERIGQVFANLVHNATKHTPTGGEIRLSAAPDGRYVVFTVRDTGDGIAENDVDRIFERFYKSDRSRADGGSGLGLSIAKHIVEAHGGAIRAASAGPGRGATFTFTLPVAEFRPA